MVTRLSRPSQRNLHSLDRIVAAVRIAGIIGFAHAGDQMSGATTISQCSRKAEENQIAAGHEGRRQPGLGNRDSHVAGKCGLRNGSECVEFDQMIVA